MTSKFTGGLAAIAALLVAACAKIDKLSPAACACQTDIIAGELDAKQLEIYVTYRTTWAENEAAYNAVELGEKAAMAKHSITQQEINRISNDASLRKRKELKECEAK